MNDEDAVVVLDNLAQDLGLSRGLGDPDIFGYPGEVEEEDTDVIIEDHPF